MATTPIAMLNAGNPMKAKSMEVSVRIKRWGIAFAAAITPLGQLQRNEVAVDVAEAESAGGAKAIAGAAGVAVEAVARLGVSFHRGVDEALRTDGRHGIEPHARHGAAGPGGAEEDIVL